MDERFMRDFERGERVPIPAMRVIVRKNAGEVRGGEFGENAQGFLPFESPERLFTFDGSVRVSRLQPPAVYKEFFQYPGRVARERGATVLRGPRFLCALDNNLAFAHKLKFLKEDFNAALDVLSVDTEPNKPGTHRMYRLAALDYVKNSVITMTNALIAPEKFGHFRLDDKSYVRTRQVAAHMAELAVRAQYAYMAGDIAESAACIRGLAQERSNIERVAAELTATVSSSLQTRTPNVPRPIIARPELAHSGVIAAAALHAAKRLKAGPPDTIVALPTGGTEYAYALQYALWKETGKKPELVLIPISIHSTKKRAETEADISTIASAIARGTDSEERAMHNFIVRHSPQFIGKRLLIADDNASSGRTIQLTADALQMSFGPKKVDVSIAEADVVRTLVRESWRDDADGVSQELMSAVTPAALKDAVNVLPVSRRLQPMTDLRKLYEFGRISKFYQNKEAVTDLDHLVRAVERKNATRYFLAEIISSPDRRNNIYSFRDTFLSNFHPVRIRFSVPRQSGERNGHKAVDYPSVEHAYQAAKFTSDVIRSITPPVLDELNASMSRIFREKKGRSAWKPLERARDLEHMFSSGEYTAGQVKVMADWLRDQGFIRKDWFDIRVQVMAELLMKKFKNPELAEQLLATGGKLLVEGNTWGDSFWGVAVRKGGDKGEIDFSQIKNGFGQNMLGLLLMEVRSTLGRQQKAA